MIEIENSSNLIEEVSFGKVSFHFEICYVNIWN